MYRRRCSQPTVSGRTLDVEWPWTRLKLLTCACDERVKGNAQDVARTTMRASGASGGPHAPWAHLVAVAACVGADLRLRRTHVGLHHNVEHPTRAHLHAVPLPCAGSPHHDVQPTHVTTCVRERALEPTLLAMRLSQVRESAKGDSSGPYQDMHGEPKAHQGKPWSLERMSSPRHDGGHAGRRLAHRAVPLRCACGGRRRLACTRPE